MRANRIEYSTHTHIHNTHTDVCNKQQIQQIVFIVNKCKASNVIVSTVRRVYKEVFCARYTHAVNRMLFRMLTRILYIYIYIYAMGFC